MLAGYKMHRLNQLLSGPGKFIDTIQSVKKWVCLVVDEQE